MDKIRIWWGCPNCYWSTDVSIKNSDALTIRCPDCGSDCIHRATSVKDIDRFVYRHCGMQSHPEGDWVLWTTYSRRLKVFEDRCARLESLLGTVVGHANAINRVCHGGDVEWDSLGIGSTPEIDNILQKVDKNLQETENKNKKCS